MATNSIADNGQRFIQNVLLAGLATAATAYGSSKVSWIPSLNMNSALASAVLSGTGATFAQAACIKAEKQDSFLVKTAAVAVLVLAFNALTQAKPITDKVSLLNVGGIPQFATLSTASALVIIGENAGIDSWRNRAPAKTPYESGVAGIDSCRNRAPAKTPYESGVAGIEEAAKAVKDARDAVEGTKKAHEAYTADKDLKTAYDAAEKTLKESTEAFKGLVTKHTWKDDAEGAKYKELNDTLFPAAPKKGE